MSSSRKISRRLRKGQSAPRSATTVRKVPSSCCHSSRVPSTQSPPTVRVSTTCSAAAPAASSQHKHTVKRKRPMLRPPPIPYTLRTSREAQKFSPFS